MKDDSRATHRLSYGAVKRALERTHSASATVAALAVTASGPEIRDITEYQTFWDSHSRTDSQGQTHAHVDPRA